MEPYKTLKGRGESEIVIDRSRFICFTAPTPTEEDALALLEEVKQRFPDARHRCYAYTVGLNHSVQRYSDAGEPHGTAGLPILGVLQKQELTDVCAVVIRYFGGILLGKGGLVRAYTQATVLSVENAGVVTMVPTCKFLAEVDYPLYERVCRLLEGETCRIEDREFSDRVLLTVACPQKETGALQDKLTQLTNGTAEFLPTWEGYDGWA